MHFYGPLIRQGYQITLDWMASYSLGIRVIFMVIFGTLSWGTLRSIFFGDANVPMLKRIARVIVEISFGPAAVIGTMFIISVLYYAPSALLQQTANDAAKLQTNLQQARDQKEIEKLNEQFADYKTERITSDQHVAANSEARLGKCRDAYNKLLNDLTDWGAGPSEIDELVTDKYELNQVRQKGNDRENRTETAMAIFAAARKFRADAQHFRAQSPDPCP
jgi:hypothetical protein